MARKRRMPRLNWQHGALAVLAAGTLAVVGFVFVKPQPVPEPFAAATATAAATPTAAPTAAPDPAVMLGAIKGLLAGSEPLTISVLGDSTGDKRGEWVDLWAQGLVKHGTVTVHFWDDKVDDWSAKVATYAGPGRAITIWNGSKSGSNHVYAMQFLDKIQPEKPSFQILSYGHNNSTIRADGGSGDLMRRLETKWGGPVPTAITLQNPAFGARATQSASSVFFLRSWAGTKGLPVLDINKAFTDAGNLPALLVEDGLGVHPNPAGQRIWADTVIAALG